MTAGRPTKLNQELIDKANTYIHGDSPEWKKDQIPSIESLALFLGVNRDTIYSWRVVPKYEEGILATFADEEVMLRQQFSDIVEDVLTLQAATLMNNGLKGSFNSSITKVILTKHGYVDKAEVENKMSGELKTGSVDPALASQFAEFTKSQSKD